MAHTGITLAGFSTVLEMASSVPVDTSAFAYAGSNLCSAADSPAPGAEMQYLVLMDYGDRRTVIASQFMGDGGANIWQRQIYQDVWRQTRWVPIATATPPQEYDLPLAEGKVVNGSCTYRKGQDGRLTLFVAVKRADGADLSGVEGAFTLPVGYRPLRQETRHIDLTDITGSPAGYAHLHIYPDGIANIAGIGGGAKSAFCECGFWTT